MQLQDNLNSLSIFVDSHHHRLRYPVICSRHDYDDIVGKKLLRVRLTTIPQYNNCSIHLGPILT